ncbi:Meiosis-specific serine/threonine-protein kinase mek1-like protein [Cladobotryum mycophilum]|uniref:Meiosis-specific serine/threonine-protein kinase mek1-like protein n=1 Tax=Cladobotryum mycophilum TaxID=491253 RepID=A0ABR0SB27_9HYPO
MENSNDQKTISYDDYNEKPVAYIYLVDGRVGDQPQEVFPIWDQAIFKIGRDPRSNTLPIETDEENMVSRNHCEIYVVVYEHSVNHIYVRDRKSFNGTYVNGNLVGIGPEMSSGYLLEDGDTIEIRPYWRFIVRQAWKPPEHPLTSLQKEECKVFADEYLVTERCIGHGADAAVYLAIETATKKQLVCKVVHLGRPHGRSSCENNRRKLQEADVLRQIQHPNILPYIDAISSPHTLYTFTELAAGGDLLSFILRREVVREFDARIILRQVVRGLSYLHSKGIVHRDLKLENILLAYSPKIAYHRIMLSDFGTCAVPRRSRMRTQVGTETYQAPEIYTRTQPQTPAVDIWSLGIVTLHLLTSGREVLGDLSLKGQEEIKAFIDKTMLKVSPKPSMESTKFVLGCLQITPEDRMTAIEAECHDWFCTPEKDFEFFQKLDRRIMTNWGPQSQLKPMPLELRSMAESILVSPDMANVSIYDQIGVVKEGSRSIEEKSQYFGEMEIIKKANVAEFTKPPPPQPRLKEVSKAAITEKKQTRPHSEGFCERVRQTPRLENTHTKSQRMRIDDTMFLPLPGLDRHLRPATSYNQRQLILAELERTNAKFLVDVQSIFMKNQDDLALR